MELNVFIILIIRTKYIVYKAKKMEKSTNLHDF